MMVSGILGILHKAGLEDFCGIFEFSTSRTRTKGFSHTCTQCCFEVGTQSHGT